MMRILFSIFLLYACDLCKKEKFYELESVELDENCRYVSFTDSNLVFSSVICGKDTFVLEENQFILGPKYFPKIECYSKHYIVLSTLNGRYNNIYIRNNYRDVFSFENIKYCDSVGNVIYYSHQEDFILVKNFESHRYIYYSLPKDINHCANVDCFDVIWFDSTKMKISYNDTNYNSKEIILSPAVR